MELRLEVRGALDSSCWRWAGREAWRDRVPPIGGRQVGEEEEEELGSRWLAVEVSGWVMMDAGGGVSCDQAGR